jgi:cytochrome c
MDSFEFNKIAGAVLGTLLFIMGLGILSDGIFHHSAPKQSAYALPSAEVETASAGAVAAATAAPIGERLAKADAKKGEGLVKACSACHVFDKGGANKVGPALYGVVQRSIASHEGFAYSDSLKGKGGKWDYASLDHFIEAPKGFANGTKMAYGGEKDAGKRADIIAYLRSLADAPAPLQ